jgi:tetratricopeptide (TPR) repeat protein
LLVMEFEEAFDLMIDEEDAKKKIQTVGQAIDYIKEEMGKEDALPQGPATLQVPPQRPATGDSQPELPTEAVAGRTAQSVSQVQPAQSAHVGPVKRRSHAGTWVAAIIVLLAVVASIAYFAGSQSPPGTWSDAQEAYGRGDLARSERVLQYLQNKTPTDANDAIHPREFAHAYCDIGDTYRQRMQYLAAIAAYQEAIAIMPANPDAHFGLASCYEHQDRLNEAITAYREAIAIQPEFAPAHCGLGFCYGRQERYSEAVSAYLRAIAIQPGYAHAYVLLGYTYSAQMREGEAIAAFERAIRLEPTGSTADAARKELHRIRGY